MIDIEAERSKNYRSTTWSTLLFLAARRKLLNGAPSMRVNDKHPRLFRFFSLSDKTSSAITYTKVSISERPNFATTYACARACNCSRRRGSSTFLDIFHARHRKRDKQERHLRKHYGESWCDTPPQAESRQEINFKNQSLVSKKSREKNVCHFFTVYAHLFQGLILLHVLCDGNNHTSFCAFQICIFTKWQANKEIIINLGHASLIIT